MPRIKKPQIRVTKELKEKVRKKLKREPTEPDFDQGRVLSNIEVLKVIDWYNLNFDTAQSKKWALEFIKKHPNLSSHKKEFQSIPHSWFGSRGFFCRILERGGMFKNAETFPNAFLSLLSLQKKEVKETPKETQNTPQNALKLKLGAFYDFCNALDVCEDDVFGTGEVDLKSKSVLEYACSGFKKDFKDALKEVKTRQELLVKDLDDGFYKGLEKKCRTLLKFYDFVCYNWLGEKK